MTTLETVALIASPVSIIVGLFAIWYQVRASKLFNKGQFLLNLDSSFENQNHDFLKKLIEHKEEAPTIGEGDRADFITYLTFFETI